MMPMSHNMEAIMSEPTPLRLKPHHGYRSFTTDWYDEQGHRRTKRFGKEGDVTERAALSRYQNWLNNEYRAKAHVRNPDDPAAFTVDRFRAAVTAHLDGILPDGGWLVEQTGAGLAALCDLYADRPLTTLDNPKLARVRDAMVFDGDGEPRSVKTVNGRLYCIKAAFKWARERDLIPAELLADVLAVRPLRAGRCEAKAPESVKPVGAEAVDAAKAFMPPTVAAMVEVQWLTGMRPGEVCMMRACDVERPTRRGAVWVYVPGRHKTKHKGKLRRVPLGPKSQAILKPFLNAAAKPAAFLFSPAAAQGERRAERAKDRKTPLSCGNRPGTNVKSRPKVKPGERYTNDSYRRAVWWACKAAGIEPWHPNQIRHAWATRMRDRFGYEAAADGLGHDAPSTTVIYAEQSLRRASKVARKVG